MVKISKSTLKKAIQKSETFTLEEKMKEGAFPFSRFKISLSFMAKSMITSATLDDQKNGLY